MIKINKMLALVVLAIYSLPSMAGMVVMSGSTLSNISTAQLSLPDGKTIDLGSVASSGIESPQELDTVVVDTVNGQTTVLSGVKPSMVINDEMNLENIDRYLDVFIYDTSTGQLIHSSTGTAFLASVLDNSVVYVNMATFYLRSALDYTAIPRVNKTAPIDTDGDTIPDAVDNCILVANTNQRDTDADGYGNMCDADINGDKLVNVIDYGQFRSAWLASAPGVKPYVLADHIDFNGDGVVNVIDYGIFRGSWLKTPGPSGLNP